MQTFALLEQDAVTVAPLLIGSLLVRKYGDSCLIGRIVETEAYNESDPASHSFRGPSERTAVMFGPAGHLYVYFTYGMHYCCNVVTGPEGKGSAVLIRALEPLEGADAMQMLRGGRTNLTNGPAKVCQALAIDKTLNGHNLKEPPLQLVLQKPDESRRTVQSTRIGISRGIDKLWRFYEDGNAHVSRR